MDLRLFLLVLVCICAVASHRYYGGRYGNGYYGRRYGYGYGNRYGSLRGYGYRSRRQNCWRRRYNGRKRCSFCHEIRLSSGTCKVLRSLVILSRNSFEAPCVKFYCPAYRVIVKTKASTATKTMSTAVTTTTEPTSTAASTTAMPSTTIEATTPTTAVTTTTEPAPSTTEPTPLSSLDKEFIAAYLKKNQDVGDSNREIVEDIMDLILQTQDENQFADIFDDYDDKENRAHEKSDEINSSDGKVVKELSDLLKEEN